MYKNAKISSKGCYFYRKILPTFAPVIYGLSQTSSKAGAYALIYITGLNFFQNGTTYVNFGNIKNIPVTYYSSFNISFVVPVNATPGNYTVTVVNIYNGNFSTPVQYSYPANLNYSKGINYSII